MGKAKEFDLEAPAPVLDEEDKETLVAMDQSIRDAEAGGESFLPPMPQSSCLNPLSPLLHEKGTERSSKIIAHIAEDDAESASRFGNSLLDHIDSLARFPRMGAVVPKRPHVRKLLHSPVLVYYRFDEDQRKVEVLHFRHGGRKPPKSVKRPNLKSR